MLQAPRRARALRVLSSPVQVNSSRRGSPSALSLLEARTHDMARRGSGGLGLAEDVIELVPLDRLAALDGGVEERRQRQVPCNQRGYEAHSKEENQTEEN